MKDFSVSKIDQQFTFNHDQQTLHYKLAGFFICTQKCTSMPSSRGYVVNSIPVLNNQIRSLTMKSSVSTRDLHVL